jgi:hypothetical protein
MKRLLVLSSLSLALAMTANPAVAQEDAGDKVNQLIIYGDDECPPSAEGEITVCARKSEGERYRIPEILREGSGPAYESWTNRVESYETVGDWGALSCTPSGSGGELGCTQKLIDAAYAEKEQSSDIRFSQLIEEERAKRLATIDEDAAAEQARVEQIEREYMERLEREREASLPGESEDLPELTEGE